MEEETNAVPEMKEEMNEDEFLDERPEEEPVPEAVEEPAPIEEAPSEEVAPEEVEEVEEPEPVHEKKERYDYSDPRLEAIENGRILWNKGYRKISAIKLIVALVVLVLIVLGWVIPTTTMKDAGAVPLYIALGVAGVGIIAVLIFSIVQKRYDKAGIAKYFGVYYDNLNAYAFDGLGIDDIQGNYDSKITGEEISASGLYPGADTSGSRENITFTYKGMDCAMADVAIQKASSKGLRTVFVGKYLRTHNNLHPDCEGNLIIYFKGNDRAIPPLAIEGLTPIESNKRYAVYGSAPLKKLLTHKFKEALAQIRTNSLLVDVAISITEGRTYWALGYEDDLMVLPNREPFDPHYVEQYKEHIRMFLDMALLLNE